MLFRNRAEAGRLLAGKLSDHGYDPDALVLGLPRGGVPVAFEVARALDLPLDIFMVRKLVVPGKRELPMGAIASGGVRVLNRELLRHMKVPPDLIDAVSARELQDLDRLERSYRGDRPVPCICGRTVILADDGLATGSSMRAAVRALRRQEPGRIVLAIPIGASSICEQLQEEVEEIVCAVTTEPFEAVDLWYYDFSETTDEEVRDLLLLAAGRRTLSTMVPATMPAMTASAS